MLHRVSPFNSQHFIDREISSLNPCELFWYKQNICSCLVPLVGSSMKCNDQNLGWNPCKAQLEGLCLRAINLQPQLDAMSPKRKLWFKQWSSPHQSASSLLMPQHGPSTFTRPFSFLAILPPCLSPSSSFHCDFSVPLQSLKVCLNSPEVLVFFSTDSSLHECLCSRMMALESYIL